MNDLFNIEAQQRLSQRQQPSLDRPSLPTLAAIHAAEASLPDPSSPSYLAGQPHEAVARHIIDDIVPALSGPSQSSRYFGFVTGGVLPLAEWADKVVSCIDQNVQVHLPAQSVATTLEHAALEMLVRLLRLGGDWPGRTVTTGATASNVLGLACAREAVVAEASIAEMGLLAACARAGVAEIQVLTSAGHSSLSKAASIVGLGRASVKELPRSEHQPWRLDLDAVERELRRRAVASIIVVSAGEVNTGRYALHDLDEWRRLRRLADQHGAWIHIDGAFGIFSRVLAHTDEYSLLHTRNQGFQLADSITIDAHKLLNVPYDCGMFLTRNAATLQSVFTNPNAAYLSPSANAAIPSPLNLGIENSRRFRALPVYAVLLSEGRPGLSALFSTMVRLARRLALFLRSSPHYELLPDDDPDEIFIVVLFRARNRTLNAALADRINATRRMYVSGTVWRGDKAVRVAVSSWNVDIERDLRVMTEVLNEVVGE